MTKRPSIKGKGADVFLSPEEQPQEEPRTATRRAAAKGASPANGRRKGEEEKRIMATFYLSPTLVDKLDRVWVERRLKDRKVQKSHIVAEALQAHLKV